MSLATDEVLLNHLPSVKHIFSEAVSHCADTFIAVSRPVSTEKTAARGTDKSVPYKVQGKAKRGAVCDRPNE